MAMTDKARTARQDNCAKVEEVVKVYWWDWRAAPCLTDVACAAGLTAASAGRALAALAARGFCVLQAHPAARGRKRGRWLLVKPDADADWLAPRRQHNSERLAVFFTDDDG